MQQLSTLFGLSLVAASITGACVVQETPDDGGEGGAEPTSNLLADSPRLAQAEIERRTYYLASPELQGRAPATEGGLMARQYVIDEMNACGIQPLDPAGFEQPIATLAGAANVLGVIPGTDPAQKERHILLSAHYDHLGVRDFQTYFGADDNAVAVATVLAIGCAIADSPQPRSVIIAAWDAEEPPHFLREGMGSQYYADNPIVPLAQTDAMIALDLIGSDMWPGYPNHFILGSELSPQVHQAVAGAAIPEGLLAFSAGLHLAEEWPLGIGRQPWSDYDAFRNANIPVLFLANGQTKRYHTPQDTPDTLNYPKVALEAKLLLRIVSALANAAENPVFDPAGADYARDAASMQTLLEHALAPGGMVDVLGLNAGSRAKMEADLSDAALIATKMSSGGALTEDEVRRLRDGAQRLLCLASSTYNESDCNLF